MLSEGQAGIASESEPVRSRIGQAITEGNDLFDGRKSLGSRDAA